MNYIHIYILNVYIKISDGRGVGEIGLGDILAKEEIVLTLLQLLTETQIG